MLGSKSLIPTDGWLNIEMEVHKLRMLPTLLHSIVSRSSWSLDSRLRRSFITLGLIRNQPCWIVFHVETSDSTSPVVEVWLRVAAKKLDDGSERNAL